MMIYPTLDDLMENVDSKYTLVVQVSKRARELVDGEKPKIDMDSNKSVTIAINEVNLGLINYRKTREGIK
ncbi:MAG TPA: DNA-directed RNA polymerase subunit omega [Clostridia bacterium]|nr:DNA-directed RNA polymerase subunit omega [Clostridia bacterium]